MVGVGREESRRKYSGNIQSSTQPVINGFMSRDRANYLRQLPRLEERWRIGKQLVLYSTLTMSGCMSFFLYIFFLFY